MPWKIFPDGNQFCIHRQNADGSKGKQVACHPSKEKALAQLKALYANAKESMPPEASLIEQKREDVTPADKKRTEKEYGDVEYADPENKKYPIDAKHVGAAWNYINKAKNAGKYSAGKLAKMKSRIAAAFKKYRGHAPPSAEEKPQEAEEMDEATEKMLAEWFDKMAECMTDEPEDKTMDEAAKPKGETPEEEKNEPPEEEKNETPGEEKAEQVATPQAVEHDHEHMHGTMTHSHKHQHDKEHGIDGQLNVKHDHPHAEKEAIADTSSMPALIRSENMKCASCKEQVDVPMEGEGAMKCPKCGATINPKPKESARALVFGESMSLREAEIDKARKTVTVTVIRPGWSANGRYYSREVLQKAIPVFEGTKCYVDHPTLDDDRNRPERSVSDIAGYYRNVKQADDGRLTAQLVLVGKRGEEVYPLIAETIANKPDLVGLSINAMGQTREGEAEGKRGTLVDALLKSFGTDVVTTASAGGRFEKLMQSGDEMTTSLLQSLTYEEWRGVSSEFEARMKKEMRTARKEELESAALKESAQKDLVINEREAEITALKESVSGLEKSLADQERESAIRVSELTADLKLLESKLPKEWCVGLRPQLLAKPGEMDALVEAEKKKYFARVEPVEVTHAGIGETVPETVAPELANVLEALKVDSAVLPLEGESPEEYGERKRKFTRR